MLEQNFSSPDQPIQAAVVPTPCEFDSPSDIREVPQVLKDIPNWCGWKYVPRDDKGKELTKPPFSCKTGYKTSVNEGNRNNWVSFEGAVASVGKFDFNGIGFIVTGTGLAGIDFDNCVNADGTIDPFAKAILKLLGDPW